MDEEYEEIEIEVDESAITAYLFDEDDNEIGFIMVDESGEEAEYYYADDPVDSMPVHHEATSFRDPDAEVDFGITREGVAEATNDMNAIYRDGVQVAAEFKGAFDDIMSALDFSDLKPGAKKK